MLLRSFLSASLLLSSAVLLAQTNPARSPANLPRTVEKSQGLPNPPLPVRRVVLYKNGVGYFEHDGRVSGNQALTIDFTSAQLDDALQSLTALDLGGGRIAAVDFNSTTPLEQQLKSIPLGLGDDPSADDLYTALRGAHVEVSGTGVPAFSGRIVDYETRTEKSAAGSEITRAFLTAVSDEGAVRTFEVTPAISVRVLDGGLRRDLDDYLTVLAATQSRQMRHLILQAQGTGTRDIRVSYITEVPVWKSTYRIVFPPETNVGATPMALLQGWAVVDNIGGSDWNDVQLSLVAGAPQSFTEPLSQPIYTHRPEVPVPEAENVAPTLHEGGEGAPPPSPPVGSASESVMVDRLAAPRAMARRMTHGEAGFAGGVMGGALGALGTGASPRGGIGSGSAAGYGAGMSGTPLQDESSSATSARFDDFFEYTLAQPVTLHRNQSALVPFLQASVNAERVTLWNPSQPAPLRALWLTNSSAETLDRGSFSVFENGEFAGEGLTDPIHAGEKRLLSYAVDQAVHVSTENRVNNGHLRHVTIHDGVLTETVEQTRDVTYVVRNAAGDPRVVVIEHPVADGWKLTSDVKPAEVTASFDRFRVATPAGETSRLRVSEEHTDSLRYTIADMQDNMLEFIVNGSPPKAWHQVFAPVLAARARLRDLQTLLDAKQKDIDRVTDDSKRLHDNIQGLKDSAEERALARRYAGEMNADEDQLQTLRKERAALEQQRNAAQQGLNDAIRNLSLDEDTP